jgi:hypothetical protein
MVERCARAIWSAYPYAGQGWNSVGPRERAAYIAQARSVIDAMREPTPDMDIAAIDYCYREGLKGWDDLPAIWRTMINAALK